MERISGSYGAISKDVSTREMAWYVKVALAVLAFMIMLGAFFLSI